VSGRAIGSIGSLRLELEVVVVGGVAWDVVGDWLLVV
jgi:hypothetical protein